MVMRVGIVTPVARWAVRLLISLQKSMDLTPRAPKAGPIGGEGVALPAGTSNFYTNKTLIPGPRYGARDSPLAALASARLETSLLWRCGSPHSFNFELLRRVTKHAITPLSHSRCLTSPAIYCP